MAKVTVNDGLVIFVFSHPLGGIDFTWETLQPNT